MKANRVDDDLRERLLALYRGGQGNGREVCPECSPNRKAVNRNQRTLAIRESEDGVVLFHCHHCGFSAGVPLHQRRGRTMDVREVTRLAVVPPPATPSMGRSVGQDDLTEAGAAWLEGRGISRATAEAARVGSRSVRLRGEDELREVLSFPYYTGGQMYAQKVRTFPDKLFTQIGSAATLWLGDQVEGGDDLIIVEGEIDALSVREVGHRSVVSVPNGAPVKVADQLPNAADDRKFQYIWAAADLFKQAGRVILACDADKPGQALAEEIARRWGRARTWRVVYPEDCKDLNEVLVKHGPEKVRELIANPEPWPVAGVYNARHFVDNIKALYEGGLGKGVDPGMGLGDLFSIAPGLSLITGIPGSGKSSWLNQLMVGLAEREGWNMAIYSSETPPEMHIPMLAQIHLGKPFFQGPTERMTPDDLEHGIAWVDRHFLFLHSPEGATYQDIIERLEVAVMRSGIRAFVVDPANYLRRTKSGEDNIEWVGEMLEAFRSFALSHDCHAFVVAHPKKMMDNCVPGGYDISGSAHWYNRPDFGITIHRPPENRDLTEFHVWKVRFSWTGKEGAAQLFHDAPTGRYSETPFHKVVYSMYDPQKDRDPWEGLH